MKPVLRLEIVIDGANADAVCDILDSHAVTGWTVLEVAKGRGERGMRRADSLRSGNQLILSTCKESDLDALVADLRPVLKRFGGVCLVSDARWVRHREEA